MLLNCVYVFFIHLLLELLTQFSYFYIFFRSVSANNMNWGYFALCEATILKVDYQGMKTSVRSKDTGDTSEISNMQNKFQQDTLKNLRVIVPMHKEMSTTTPMPTLTTPNFNCNSPIFSTLSVRESTLDVRI